MITGRTRERATGVLTTAICLDLRFWHHWPCLLEISCQLEHFGDQVMTGCLTWSGWHLQKELIYKNLLHQVSGFTGDKWKLKILNQVSPSKKLKSRLLLTTSKHSLLSKLEQISKATSLSNRLRIFSLKTQRNITQISHLPKLQRFNRQVLLTILTDQDLMMIRSASMNSHNGWTNLFLFMSHRIFQSVLTLE